MSAEGLVPWIYEDDPELRENLAEGVLREMHSLMQHPGWARLCKVIDQKIVAGRDTLEQGRDTDTTRGAIKALRIIKGIPQDGINRAAAELKLHRGE